MNTSKNTSKQSHSFDLSSSYKNCTMNQILTRLTKLDDKGAWKQKLKPQDYVFETNLICICKFVFFVEVAYFYKKMNNSYYKNNYKS